MSGLLCRADTAELQCCRHREAQARAAVSMSRIPREDTIRLCSMLAWVVSDSSEVGRELTEEEAEEEEILLEDLTAFVLRESATSLSIRTSRLN